MMAAMYITVFLITLLVPMRSISTCDEVDLVFLIDTDSIRNKGNSLIDFITTIIWSGSSERSAFSVVLYGEGIPIQQQITLIHLQETHDITRRQDMEIRMIDALETAFYQIDLTLDTFPMGAATKFVSLLQAIQTARNQNAPDHRHKVKRRLNIDPAYHVDKKAFFVFDHYNALINEEKNVLCALLKSVKHHKDESIHFLLGHAYRHMRIPCADAIPLHMQYTLFNHFDENNMDSLLQMVYAITCPSTLYFPQLDGHLRLAHYNQWMDGHTIVKCHLVQRERTAMDAPPQLNHRKSYILVRDYYHDDNTFKLNDYLLADPVTYHQFQNNGCSSSPIYKIRGIHRMPHRHPHYQLLKLFVSLPLSMFEYVSAANIKRDSVPIHHQTNDRRQLIEVKGNTADSPDNPHYQITFKFGKDWEYTRKGGIKVKKEKAEGKSLIDLAAPTITVGGTGSIELKHGYSFELVSHLTFNFLWQLHALGTQKEEQDTILKFEIGGQWHFNAYFDAKAEGKLKVEVDKLLHFEKTFTFFIHVVPVIFTPFVSFNLEIETTDMDVQGRVDCDFAEEFAIGYDYHKKEINTPQFVQLKPKDMNLKFAGTEELQIWKEDIETKELCASHVYEHNYQQPYIGGNKCYFFDWNEKTKKCRCKLGHEYGQEIKYEPDPDTLLFRLGYKNCKYEERCNMCPIFDWKWNSDEFYCGHVDKDKTGECKEVGTEESEESKKTCACAEMVYCAICDIAAPEVRTTFKSNHPIKKQKKLTTYKEKEMNKCTKTFKSITGDESQCPTDQELGFTVTTKFKQGVNFYAIIQVYLEEKFILPFRIHVPATDATQCGKSERWDSCASEEDLKMLFTIECIFELWFGFKFVMPEFPVELMEKLKEKLPEDYKTKVETAEEEMEEIKKAVNYKVPIQIEIEKERTEERKSKIRQIYEAITEPKRLYKTTLIPLTILGCLDAPVSFRAVCCPLMKEGLGVLDMTVGLGGTQAEDQDVTLSFDGILKWPKHTILLRSIGKPIAKEFDIKGTKHPGFEVDTGTGDGTGGAERAADQVYGFIFEKAAEKQRDAWLSEIERLQERLSKKEPKKERSVEIEWGSAEEIQRQETMETVPILKGEMQVQSVNSVKETPTSLSMEPHHYVRLYADGYLKWFGKTEGEWNKYPESEIQLRGGALNSCEKKTFTIGKNKYEGFEIEVEQTINDKRKWVFVAIKDTEEPEPAIDKWVEDINKFKLAAKT